MNAINEAWAVELLAEMDDGGGNILPFEAQGKFWGGAQAILEYRPDGFSKYIGLGVQKQASKMFLAAQLSYMLELDPIRSRPHAVEVILDLIVRLEDEERYTKDLRWLGIYILDNFGDKKTIELLDVLTRKHDLARREDLGYAGKTPWGIVDVIWQQVLTLDESRIRGKRTPADLRFARKMRAADEMMEHVRRHGAMINKRISVIIPRDCKIFENELHYCCYLYRQEKPRRGIEFSAIDLLLKNGAEWQSLVSRIDELPECKLLLDRPWIRRQMLEDIANTGHEEIITKRKHPKL